MGDTAKDAFYIRWRNHRDPVILVTKLAQSTCAELQRPRLSLEKPWDHPRILKVGRKGVVELRQGLGTRPGFYKSSKGRIVEFRQGFGTRPGFYN